MSINKVSKKAPNLRFKGFTDDWEQRRLGEVSEKNIEKNKDNKFSETFTNSAEYGIISQRDFFDKDISNKKNLNTYYVVREDDFVYNPRISNFAPVGPINRNKLDRVGVMSPLYYVFRTHGINKVYLEYYFYGTKWHRFMKINGDSGARSDRLAIRDSVFVNMPIPFPKSSEQEKIGTFLKNIDNTITLHQRKLDQLKQLKEALLQQMFPGKGETVPKLRFVDFNDEWEERKLGEMVGTISSGNRLPKSELTKGNVPYIVAQTKNNGVFGYISENTKDYNGNDMKLFPSNSISFSIDNPEAIFYRNEPFYTSNIMRVIHNETLSEFDYIFIIESMKMFTKSYDWSRKFSGPIVSNLKIMFPMDNEEQLKIGQFFKQLDNTITLQQRKLEQLQNMKQVLLQNMFI